MNDKTTKRLLAAIALGLWANAAALWLRPQPLFAQAQNSGAQAVQYSMLVEIESHVSKIAKGTCANKTIC